MVVINAMQMNVVAASLAHHQAEIKPVVVFLRSVIRVIAAIPLEQ